MAFQVRPSVVKHNYVSRARQERTYTTAAHYRYIVRESAAEYVEHHHFPAGKNPYKAQQAFLRQRERSIRKDGRVCDKLTFIFPKEMNIEHAAESVRRAMRMISEDRTPYLFSLHNFALKGENPHAHVLFIDADVKTKKRVFQTTDLGSTERIKDIWEFSTNSVLMENGYDFYLDRKAYALLKQAEEERIERLMANDNVLPDAPTEDIAPELVQGDGIPNQEADMGGRLLARYDIGGREFYCDERLREYRAVDDPSFIIQFDHPSEHWNLLFDHPPVLIAEAVEVHDLPSDAPTEQLDEQTMELQDSEDVSQEQHMPEPVKQRVARAVAYSQRLNELRADISRLATVRGEADRAELDVQAAKHHLEAARGWHSSAVESETYARQDLDFHVNSQGKARGVKLPSWLPGKLGGWRSQTRIAADAAIDKAETATRTVGRAAESVSAGERAAERALEYAQQTAHRMNDEVVRVEKIYGRTETLNQRDSELYEMREKAVEALGVSEVYAAYQAEEITAEEALEMFQLMGDIQYSEAIRRDLGLSEGNHF